MRKQIPGETNQVGLLRVDGADDLFQELAVTLVMNIGDLDEAMLWPGIEANAFDIEPGWLEARGVSCKCNRRTDRTHEKFSATEPPQSGHVDWTLREAIRCSQI